ncbi:MAG TPA: RnfABCDGE type electron transport complex subunit D [Longimicrobiales bacterium]|nr:RnfABCDGE type electron transport complex subunit D [Longimicrobiales bacterium]
MSPWRGTGWEGSPEEAGARGDPRLRLVASPHLHAQDSTARIMWSVVATLLPVVAASTYFFGVGALLIVAATVLGALLTERVFGPGGAVRDGSAAITGLLLGLTLPPGFPLWMAFTGGAFGIGFGKLIFGGLGQNIFNPALLGRAFLQAAFPTAITTWPAVRSAAEPGSWLQLRGDVFAPPLMTASDVDAVTQATPLGLMKFEGEATGMLNLLVGSTGGSLGETSALLILLGGGYLAARNYLNWRIPVGIFATVGALSWLLHAMNPAYPGPLFMLFSGGLMLGAVYMATDMVTSPVTRGGAWLFAFGIGALVVLIRVWGGLPEGVMYAILLMNAMVPFIERVTRPRVFGSVGNVPRRGVAS